MGQLIVIEGTDGAGKTTAAEALTGVWQAEGISVGRLKFPRYGNPHADLIKEALYGAHGDLGKSVYGMGVLYALDRFHALPLIHQYLAEYDVLFVDRYIASNAAYQAARLHHDASSEVVDWVRELEVERYGLPLPQSQILLNNPHNLVMERIHNRADLDPVRGADLWEVDGDLQSRCAKVYLQLAEREWLAPWHVVDNDQPVDYHELAGKLLNS